MRLVAVKRAKSREHVEWNGRIGGLSFNFGIYDNVQLLECIALDGRSRYVFQWYRLE